MEDWAVPQIMPGPNVVNLSIMLGERYFGWRGARAVARMLTFPMLISLTPTPSSRPTRPWPEPCAAWAPWRQGWWRAWA
jgi:hypothetical protein